MKKDRATVQGHITRGCGLSLVACIALAGCTEATRDDAVSPFAEDGEGIDTGTSVDNASAADDEDVAPAAPPEDTAPDNDAGCEDEERRAADVLATRCASCHANGKVNGGFGEALDLDAIIAKGLIVFGSLPGSEIYAVTISGDMPENGPRLTPEEQGALSDWILCVPGTPPPNVPPAGGGDDEIGDDDPADDDDVDDDNVDDDDDDADEALDEQRDRDEDLEEDRDDDAEEAAED